jgi:hypothetical protein
MGTGGASGTTPALLSMVLVVKAPESKLGEVRWSVEIGPVERAGAPVVWRRSAAQRRPSRAS